MEQEKFMTIKERDYVHDYFSKSFKNSKTDIDYAHIFTFTGSRKIKFVRNEDNKPANLVFGKESRKSNKRPRIFTSIPNEDLPNNLCTRMELENVISNILLLKYFDVENDKDRSKYINKTIMDKFTKFCEYSKFFRVLGEYYNSLDRDRQRVIFQLFIENFQSINSVANIKQFMDIVLENVPSFKDSDINEYFLNNFAYYDTGLCISTALIIKNVNLIPLFYKKMICFSKPVLENNEVWSFLAVLYSGCNKSDQLNLIIFSREKIFELKKGGDDKLSVAKYFLKAVGLNVEDIN